MLGRRGRARAGRRSVALARARARPPTRSFATASRLDGGPDANARNANRDRRATLRVQLEQRHEQWREGLLAGGQRRRRHVDVRRDFGRRRVRRQDVQRRSAVRSHVRDRRRVSRRLLGRRTLLHRKTLRRILLRLRHALVPVPMQRRAAVVRRVPRVQRLVRHGPLQRRVRAVRGHQRQRRHVPLPRALT